MEGFCNFSRALPHSPFPSPTLRNHDRGRGRRSHNASVGQKKKKLWPPSRGLPRRLRLRLRLGMGSVWRLATKGALISPANVKNCGYADELTAISGVVFVVVVVGAAAAVKKCKFHFCFAFSHCFYSSSNNF